MINQIRRRETVAVSRVSVIWTASGNRVFSTKVSEFDLAVKAAKENEVNWRHVSDAEWKKGLR